MKATKDATLVVGAEIFALRCQFINNRPTCGRTPSFIRKKIAELYATVTTDELERQVTSVQNPGQELPGNVQQIRSLRCGKLSMNGRDNDRVAAKEDFGCLFHRLIQSGRQFDWRSILVREHWS